MKNVLDDSTPLHIAIKKWMAEFKRDRTSLEGDPRSRRPKTSSTEGIVKKMHDIAL